MAPVVQTVLGDVPPDALGRTLTHEHLSMVFSHFYREPPSQLADKFGARIDLQNVGYVRQYPYSLPYNLVLNDSDANEAVEKDLHEYKKYGGGTIVENTTEGIDRNLSFLRKMSQKTGVHIVAGSGYYIAGTQSQSSLLRTKEEMYDYMLKEMTVGCEGVEGVVKTGFLGEIASDWPIKDFERRAIVAAGEVQEQLGCAVSFHPHRVTEAPFHIVRLYLEAGGKADKAVMSHLDRTIQNNEKLLSFAELGTYCQFDLFGVEVSYYQLNVETDMASDAQRLGWAKLLADDGREQQVLMSHDIHTKHRLAAFGGQGYSHIINNVLPKMKTKGFSEKTIDQITIKNPADWLAFNNT